MGVQAILFGLTLSVVAIALLDCLLSNVLRLSKPLLYTGLNPSLKQPPMNYKQYAIAQFNKLMYQPTPSLFLRDDVKRILVSYNGLVVSVVFLCKPFEVENPDAEIENPISLMAASEFLDAFPDSAWKISDSIFHLVDSCKHAIAAIDPDAPKFEMDERAMAQLVRTFDAPWDSSSEYLKNSFGKTQRLLSELCPINARYRAALIRLGYSFAIAEELIAQFKAGESENTFNYVRNLNSN